MTIWLNVLQTNNSLIAQPLSGSPNCACRRLILTKTLPPILTCFRAPDIAEVGTVLNVFNYDSVLNQSPSDS